ncbi:hypothetical protein D3C84_180430 [compost metagenome]
MIPFGSLLEPVETRAYQLVLVLTQALLSELIAGVPIAQLGRTLPPVMGQPGVLGFTQTSLIPAPHLQRRFTANIGIRRQRPGLIRGLLHPTHGLWIIGLGSQTIGKLILRLALALLSSLLKLLFCHRSSGTTSKPACSNCQQDTFFIHLYL